MTELTSGRISIGRAAPDNRPDVCLEPDPEQWVSRLHCFLERDGGAWCIQDNATPNGTLVRRGDEAPERVVGPRRLQDGDVICILGSHGPDGPLYWELAFSDPFSTRQAEPRVATRPLACVEYDSIQAKVYAWDGGRRREIPDLSPKAHTLIRYMAERSKEIGGAPIACTHDELIHAVWGGPETWNHRRSYTRENLRDSDQRSASTPGGGSDPASPPRSCAGLRLPPGHLFRALNV